MAIVTIGEQIKSFRKERGLTQKQLANACGMADSAIRKYESGRVRPKMTTIFRIAKALVVEPLELTAHDPNYPITFTVPSNEAKTSIDYMFGLTQVQRRINTAMNKLNNDGQQEAVKRIEELAEIPRYRRQDAPEPPPPPSDSKDAPTGQDAAEVPQKPEEDG